MKLPLTTIQTHLRFKVPMLKSHLDLRLRQTDEDFQYTLRLIDGMREQRGEVSICPNCDYLGPTGDYFGYRTTRDNKITQSWCRACRSASGEKSVAK